MKAGAKVLIVDDLLATGGTLKAAEDLITKIEGTEVAASFCLFDIPALKGKDRLTKPFVSLCSLSD